MDSDEYIAFNKTLDPKVSTDISSNHSIKQELLRHIPKYSGMPHPPPKTNNPQCDGKPWSAPIMANVTTRVPVAAAAAAGKGLNGSRGNSSLGNTTAEVNKSVAVGVLNLTMCNWYLPQGPGVPALYRSARHDPGGYAYMLSVQQVILLQCTRLEFDYFAVSSGASHS